MVKLTVATSLAFFQIALLSRTSVGLPMPVADPGLIPGVHTEPVCPVTDEDCRNILIKGAIATIGFALGTACYRAARDFCKQRGYVLKAPPGESNEGLTTGTHHAQDPEQGATETTRLLDGHEHPGGTRPNSPGSQQQAESGARHDKRDMLMRWDKREISAGTVGARSLHDFEKRGWEKFDELD